jgi:hypothetical protein
MSINGVQMIIEKLQDWDGDVWLNALDCIKTLCVLGTVFCNPTALDAYYFSDDFWATFISTHGIHKILENLEDLDQKVQNIASDCIKTLCIQGIIFCNLIVLCIYQISDDMRTAFISINGIQKIIEKLNDPNWNVQMTALDCIQSLCVQGIVDLFSHYHIFIICQMT